MLEVWWIGLRVLLMLTLLTGIIYPLAVTGMAQVFFPKQAQGSLIVEDGQVRGSRLIGQAFSDPAYFWGRPSATAPMPFNAAASAGSNLGPANPALLQVVHVRLQALNHADPHNPRPVPVDLVTASASGLDPHLSLAGAFYQAPRIARLRGLSHAAVEDLIKRHTRGRFLAVLGEPVVNVLELNRALDKGITRDHGTTP
jgi:K+-transporting ATPase ATPase C chain